MLKPFDYPHPEVVEAFSHGATQTDATQSGGDFMTPWFAKRYAGSDERLFKFAVYMAITDYLVEYRDVLDAVGLNVSGSEESGDLAHGILVRFYSATFARHSSRRSRSRSSHERSN